MSRRERQSIYDASCRRKILPETFEQTPEPCGIIGGGGEELPNTLPRPKLMSGGPKVQIIDGNGKPQRTAFRADLELE